MRYTPLGFYYLCTFGALLILGVRREVNLLLLVAGMMVWPLCLNYWIPKRLLRTITLRFRVPETACIGEKVRCEAELATNSKYRFAGVSPFLGLKEGHFQLEKVQEFSPERSETRRVLTWRIWFDRRGEYSISGLKLTSSFPFGLLKNSRTFDSPSEKILVPPKLAEVPDLEEMLGSASAEVNTANSNRNAAPLRRLSGDFAGLRPWTSGDFWRQIHWRASARNEQLLVQNFDSRPRREFCLIADFSDSDETHFEEQVSYAASVTRKIYQLFVDGNRTSPESSLRVAVIGKNVRILSTRDSFDFYYEMLREFALVERPTENAPRPEASQIAEDFRAEYPNGAILTLRADGLSDKRPEVSPS